MKNKKQIKLVSVLIIVAIVFGIAGYLIGKNQNSNTEIKNKEEVVTTFLKDITTSDVIAIYFNFDGVRQYLLTSPNSIEKLLENIQSYDVEKLENEPGVLDIVDGGAVMTVITTEFDCYSIVFNPMDYKVYCGEFYTTYNNDEFYNSIMRIVLEDIKENDSELYQIYLEDGLYDYYDVGN